MRTAHLHQLYRTGVGSSGGPQSVLRSDVGGGGQGQGSERPVQWVMGNGQMGPPPEQNDRHLRKHYLPETLLAGGNYPDTQVSKIFLFVFAFARQESCV